MSTTLALVERMMGELGPITPQISQIVQEAEGNWSIHWDEMFWIAVEFNPERAGLLLWTTLGRPDDDYLVPIYESMLVTNAMYAGIGSLRIALSRPGEDLLLFGEYMTSCCVADELRTDISSFAAHALSLAGVISNPASPDKRNFTGRSSTENILHSLA